MLVDKNWRGSVLVTRTHVQIYNNVFNKRVLCAREHYLLDKGTTGVLQAVAIDPANLDPSFCAVEKLVEDANVNMDSYGVLTSTHSKRILNSNPAFAGGSDSVWEKLRDPIGSPEVTDDRCFAGAWNNLTFALWGRGVELLIDQVTVALTGQVRIFASLLCDIGIRYPSAFAVTVPVAGA
jgi:hypothetical protein